MTSVLPDGLITIGHSQIQHYSSDHYADILFERSHILYSFWKVHTIRYRVSKSTSDCRSQNLFWRTWSDGILSSSITTPTLMSLWQDCQKDIDIDLNRLAGEVPPPLEIVASVPESSCNLPPSVSTGSLKSSIPSGAWTTSEDMPSSAQATIIPKLRTKKSSNEGFSVAGDENEVGKRSPQTARPKLNRATSTNNRVSFGGTTARAKNRPSLNRRKSSQTAAQNKPTRIPRSSLKSPEIAASNQQKLDPPQLNTATSVFQLPSPSSWEDEPGPDRPRLAGSLSPGDATAELVVEPDFRHKFAERIASSTNLAGVNRLRKTGSVVRFADDLPIDSGKDERQENTGDHEFQSRPAIPHRASIVSIASTAISDEDDMALPELPRTKSQLSMMIDEKIAQHGRESLGSLQPALKNDSKAQGLSKSTEEEKLLAMAHREGATRAGGRLISRRFRLTEDSESRYSSPSPPPIF